MFALYNIKVDFKFGSTLCSMLTKVKDPLSLEKQSNEVYEIPYSCGKVYTKEETRD